MHTEGMLSTRTLQPRMSRWYRAGMRLLSRQRDYLSSYNLIRGKYFCGICHTGVNQVSLEIVYSFIGENARDIYRSHKYQEREQRSS
jgi:hypothetical protein